MISCLRNVLLFEHACCFVVKVPCVVHLKDAILTYFLSSWFTSYYAALHAVLLWHHLVNIIKMLSYLLHNLLCSVLSCPSKITSSFIWYKSALFEIHFGLIFCLSLWNHINAVLYTTLYAHLHPVFKGFKHMLITWNIVLLKYSILYALWLYLCRIGLCADLVKRWHFLNTSCSIHFRPVVLR